VYADARSAITKTQWLEVILILSDTFLSNYSTLFKYNGSKARVLQRKKSNVIKEELNEWDVVIMRKVARARASRSVQFLGSL